MKLTLLTGNLGLKIIALILAIAVYYALKTSDSDKTKNNDRQRIFQQHRK